MLKESKQQGERGWIGRGAADEGSSIGVWLHEQAGEEDLAKPSDQECAVRLG